MSTNDEYADFLEHAAKANEHANLAEQVYQHRETTDEANYWMLNAIFETMTAIAVLLQAEHDARPIMVLRQPGDKDIGNVIARAMRPGSFGLTRIRSRD